MFANIFVLILLTIPFSVLASDVAEFWKQDGIAVYSLSKSTTVTINGVSDENLTFGEIIFMRSTITNDKVMLSYNLTEFDEFLYFTKSQSNIEIDRFTGNIMDTSYFSGIFVNLHAKSVNKNYVITDTVIPYYDFDNRLLFTNYIANGEKYDIPAIIDKRDNKITSWHARYSETIEKIHENYEVNFRLESRLYFSTLNNMVTKNKIIHSLSIGDNNTRHEYNMDIKELSNIDIISFHRRVLVPFSMMPLIIAIFVVSCLRYLRLKLK
jgi:hypothetical protein